MLADKLYYGCPPAIDFIYLPIKAGIAECKSSSRRSMWTPYEVYLEPDRLLLYQVPVWSGVRLVAKRQGHEGLLLQVDQPQGNHFGAVPARSVLQGSEDLERPDPRQREVHSFQR